MNWCCTQTKQVIFLDYSAYFQDSAGLYQDLLVLYQDSVVLATLLRVVNNTHRKRERMNKQEHWRAQFGRVWNRERTPFEPCCDMNYRQRSICTLKSVNGSKGSLRGKNMFLMGEKVLWMSGKWCVHAEKTKADFATWYKKEKNPPMKKRTKNSHCRCARKTGPIRQAV